MKRRSLALGCSVVLVVAVGRAADDPPPPPLKTPTVGERLQRMAALRTAPPASKVRAVLVGDTDDEDLGEGAAVDLGRVRGLLAAALAPEEHSVLELRGKKACRTDVLSAVASLPQAGPGETVLVYVSSHGRMDDAGRHLLLLGGEVVYRTHLEDAIRRLRPQLGILVTDACANRGEIKPRDRQLYENWLEGKRFIDQLLAKQVLTPNKRMVRGLLLEHRGFVDINGCLPKGAALSDRANGGFFTAALSLASCHDASTMAPAPRRGKLPAGLEGKVEGKDFRIGSARVDRNGDGFVDWAEFTSGLLLPYFAIFYQSADQSPWVIRLN